MFKYNELSDLLTGELVKPIKFKNDKIVCLNENLEIVEYDFEDFDFDKTPEERMFIVDDPTQQEQQEQQEQEEKEQQEQQEQEEKEQQEQEELSDDKSGFLSEEKKINFLLRLGYSTKEAIKMNVYRDVII